MLCKQDLSHTLVGTTLVEASLSRKSDSPGRADQYQPPTLKTDEDDFSRCLESPGDSLEDSVPFRPPLDHLPCRLPPRSPLCRQLPHNHPSRCFRSGNLSIEELPRRDHQTLRCSHMPVE